MAYDDEDYTEPDDTESYYEPDIPEQPDVAEEPDEEAIPAGAQPTGYNPDAVDALDLDDKTVDENGYVVDPDLLKQLGTPTPPPQQTAATDKDGYVTDPELLKQLGTPTTDKDGYVTDPELLKQLGRPDLPAAEGAFGAFTREALHGAPPAVGAAVGGMMAGGAAGSIFPGIGTVAGLGVGLAGGAIGGMLTETVADKGQKLIGFDDDLMRTANQQAHPWASAAGTAFSNLAGFGPGLAKGAVGWAGRALSGVISGGGEAAVQAYHGKSVEEAAPAVLAQTAMGAIAPHPWSWGRAAEAAGARLGERIRPREAYGPPEMQGPRQPPYVEPTDQPLPFGESPPYNPRYGAPQEAQIGGGERQLGLPFEQPAAPEARSPQEIPFNRPTVDAEGQYGFNIEAPHGVGVPRTTYEDGKWVTQQASRPAMPDTGGVAKESTPPVGDRSTGDTRYGKEAQAREEPGSGINVLQPGQVDPTLRGGLQIRPREAPVTEPAAPTRYGGQFKQEPPRAAPEPAAGPPRVATPELDAAVARATAPEPVTSPAPVAAPARAKNLGEQLKERVAAERTARTEAAPLDRPMANRLLNQPRTLRQEAAKRGMTPEALKAQAQEVARGKPAEPVPVKPVEAAPVEPVAAPKAAPKAAPAADEDLTIPDFLRRKPQALSRQETDIRRQDVVRGRSGRPIETRRLPIGTEKRILEKGAERATGPKGEPREPYRLPSERKGPEPAGKPRVVTHDGAVFTGDTVHAAAAYAKGAGYRPHQIFETSGKLYEAPRAAAAAAAAEPAAKPAAAAKPAEAPKTAAEPERDLVPATKSDLKTGLLATLRRNLGGMAMVGSESAQIAQAALRKAYGPLARLKEQTATRITNDIHRVANNMDKPAFEKFVDAFESNKVSTLPKDQQALAEVLQKNYADFWSKIKELPGTEQMEATKDFLTHMYQNPEAVDKFARDFFGASGGSLRERKYPTFADARAAGLTALSNNPVEHFIRYSEGVSNYLGQRQMMLDIEGQNRLGYFGPKIVGASGTPEPLVRGAPPEGYAKIEVPWATKNGQQAYAPRDIAETINQHYSAGLRRAQTKDIYEFLQQTKNAWTAVELGLSAYHATTMGVESMASGMGRAMQMAGSGRYADATAQLLKAPAEPVTAYLYGREGRKIYRDTTGTVGTPMQRQIMDILTQANVQPGNLRITGEYDMSRLGNFWDARKRGSLPHEFQAQMKSIADSYGLKLPGVLIDNLRRAMQTISKPLFEHYIPELKLGTMMKDMEAWYKANPNATDAQALKYARKVADSVDNRMGEMNYDNLFMNKSAKDFGMLTLRSFGFTVGGPIREIGAGAGRLALTAAKRENPLKHFDLRSEAADPRTAYAMAFLPTIAAISAVYQGLRTGELPSDWRDLVTPKTGGKVKSVGKEVPERILVPGYHKDFLGYFVNDPMHEIGAKIAAPWTTIMEQLTGKDWRGKDYVPPRATTLEWLKAHALQAGSHALPIGPKQLAEGTKKGSALTIPEQMLGVRTPGAYMLNPKGLEEYLTKQRQREFVGQERQTNRERASRGLPPLPARKLPQASQ